MFADILDLNVALRTETHAPEILPFQTELVESVLEALKNQKVDQTQREHIFILPYRVITNYKRYLEFY